ncbi:MAG: hypothetical protein R3B45_00235 [Bdellovibrionota bacterium]
MKKPSIIAAIILGLLVSQSVSASWHAEIISKETATDPEGIVKILLQNIDKFQDDLNKATAMSLVGIKTAELWIEASVTHYRYTWVGNTICTPDDPRLEVMEKTSSICTIKGNKEICIAEGVLLPIEDPCSENTKKPYTLRKEETIKSINLNN